MIASIGAPLCACGKPVTDSAFLCTTCSRNLRRDLLALPALIADMQTTMSRQSRSGGATRRGGDTPLPVHREAADVIWSAWNTLGTWARHVAETTGTGLPWSVNDVPLIAKIPTERRATVDRCPMSELPVEMCAHCTGVTLVSPPEVERTFVARYGGRCMNCDRPISVGDTAGWTPDHEVVCPRCVASAA